MCILLALFAEPCSTHCLKNTTNLLITITAVSVIENNAMI
jgi:hypothetical protein